MPTSPRDVVTYLNDLTSSVKQLDSRVDMEKGPIATMAYGFATQGSRTESLSTYLQSLYQFSDPSLIRDEDMYELMLDFGKDPNVAHLAKVTVYFFRNTRPQEGETYYIRTGTIVSTSDGRLSYQVIEERTMNGNIPDVYFNSSEGRYEISAVCEAIAVGTDFNVPPNTINTIRTVQDDFDGCVNKTYARRGDDPPDKYGQRNIIWNAMQGGNQDVAGQINVLISDMAPTGVDDYEIVTSTDLVNFRRLSTMQGKIGYDVYMITDSIVETTDTGTASGGESFLSFDRKPVVSVQYVAVDGTQVPFSLDVDTSDAFRGSPSANDRVELASALQPGQTWEVSYLYYDVVYGTNSALQSRTKLFGSDVLVRVADTVDIYIAGNVTAFATAELSDVIDDIRAYTQNYFRNPDNPGTPYQKFVRLLDPSDYQRSVETTVNGVQEFQLTRFARLDRATMDIERLSFDGYTEYPVLSVNFDVT